VDDCAVVRHRCATPHALLEVVVPSFYRPGNVVIALFIGSIVGFALVLVARERRRYRAAAIDHTGDVAALRKKPWGEFEILVGEMFRRQGYVVKEHVDSNAILAWTLLPSVAMRR